MRDIASLEMLGFLIERSETRADALQRVRMPAYDLTVHELRRFAEMG